MYQIEVCIDCHLQHHTGNTEPNTSPWSLLQDGQTVTDNTTCAACFDAELGCEHNTITFSHTYCEGCGSTVAGNRFNYVVWEADVIHGETCEPNCETCADNYIYRYTTI